MDRSPFGVEHEAISKMNPMLGVGYGSRLPSGVTPKARAQKVVGAARRAKKEGVKGTVRRLKPSALKEAHVQSGLKEADRFKTESAAWSKYSNTPLKDRTGPKPAYPRNPW